MAGQAVLATVVMAGAQHTDVAVHYGGTPEAWLGVRVGRVLMYLHSTRAADRLAQVWTDARTSALLLPHRAAAARGRSVAPAGPLNLAEPSVVVHTSGVPPAVAQLIRPSGREVASGLSVAIGSVRFVVSDQLAFASCLTTFERSAAAAARTFWQVRSPGRRGRDVTARVMGAQADRAQEEIEGRLRGFHWFGVPSAEAAARAARAVDAGARGGPPARTGREQGAAPPPATREGITQQPRDTPGRGQHR